MFKAILIAIALSMVMAPTDSAVAAEKKRDHDEVRGVMKQQKILPYGEIARLVKSRYNGRIVGQELRKFSRDRWVYEMKVLRDDGQVIMVLVDAHSGRIMGGPGRR
ncbi:MAG: hypothetical protein IH996_07795 [Proteobacteria bacterium]|nr:hypothetical protein [Pseudomonadota bacterium]